MPFESIKKRFPYGKIENARNIKATVQYLVHKNDLSKKQYPWESVITNCKDMTPYKVQSSSQQEITLQAIYDRIDIGEIKAWNVAEKVPTALFAGNKGRINNALEIARERILLNKDRSIDVIFISGATGTGKTTFAKNYAKSLNKSFCISSASNDPVQDYKDEDILILDDLRDYSFSFSDFLKLLDNHTISTAKSRYRNKPFMGDTIIITSIQPLDDWYYHVKTEDRHQLKRRVRFLYKFTYDQIFAFEYNDLTFRHEPVGFTVNDIARKAKEMHKRASSVFRSMGMELTPIDRKCITDGSPRDPVTNECDTSNDAWRRFEAEFKKEQADSGKWDKPLDLEKKKGSKKTAPKQ
jgi:DNA polymerase III delta prime subunit